jgi:hypothetical protein
MPEIARLMTSCWISLVPSKIVWLTLTGFVSAAQCCHVPLTRRFAIRVSDGWCSVRSVLGMTRENGPPLVAGLNPSEHGTAANTSGKVRGAAMGPRMRWFWNGGGIIGCRSRALGSWQVAGAS